MRYGFTAFLVTFLLVVVSSGLKVRASDDQCDPATVKETCKLVPEKDPSVISACEARKGKAQTDPIVGSCPAPQSSLDGATSVSNQATLNGMQQTHNYVKKTVTAERLPLTDDYAQISDFKDPPQDKDPNGTKARSNNAYIKEKTNWLNLVMHKPGVDKSQTDMSDEEKNYLTLLYANSLDDNDQNRIKNFTTQNFPGFTIDDYPKDPMQVACRQYTMTESDIKEAVSQAATKPAIQDEVPDLKGLYPDNKYTLDKTGSAAGALKASLQKAKDQGKIIDHIEIVSCSSSLKNTRGKGDMRSLVDDSGVDRGNDMAWLSNTRATQTSSFIKDTLGSQIKDKQLVVSSQGDNGDGSCGPPPPNSYSQTGTGNCSLKPYPKTCCYNQDKYLKVRIFYKSMPEPLLKSYEAKLRSQKTQVKCWVADFGKVKLNYHARGGRDEFGRGSGSSVTSSLSGGDSSIAKCPSW